MATWFLKAGAQGAISLLPGRSRLNYLLQRHVTRSVVLSATAFEKKVRQCRRHLENFQQNLEVDRPPASALELGTGWYPIVPVGLLLAGTERVHTIDVTPLLELERTRRVLQLYASYLESGALETLLPGIRSKPAEAVIAAAHDRTARTAGELLGRVGIRVLVGDARESGLAPGSVELFISNNTFEHIPEDVLRKIISEFRRLAPAGAVMDHFIDMSDHYAHFDRSITEFNYMRYSDLIWRAFNNRLQYQNRLRVSDYRRMVEGAGFRVVAEDNQRGAPEDLDQIRLAARFQRYDRDDLLVLRSWMTGIASN